MKRISVLCCLAIAGASQAITVPGTANLFGAGYGDTPNPAGGNGGTVAPFFAVTGGESFTFSATGLVNFTGGTPNVGPDGANGGLNIFSHRSIAGIQASRQQFLAAVFLSDTLPAAAPERLNFNVIGTSFTELTPELGQTFFVGDGLTGTGTGDVQTFVAPIGATRVFVGFTDGFAYQGTTGYYGDNTGSFEVSMQAVPEPGSIAVLALGAISLLRKRKK